jgi:CheY-like chemotaxis protein
MTHRAAPEGSALRRHAGNVLAAAQRAKALVDQILDYSRSQRVPRNPVDVRTVVDETLDLLRASLSPDIRLEVGNDTQPLVVICDPTHVHQIVMNLCTNAVQAMPAGGTLRVMRARQDVPMGRALSHGALLAGPYVLLTVSDTGTGMSAELLKRAFEPFFTTKDPGAGTGLGLALVQNIVTELGGAIDVQSTPGQGSTFCIYLPRFDTPAVEAPNGSVLKSGSGQRVMVVEDERGLLLLAEEILASLGYEPAGFPNAREAIDALAADPSQFDAALIDYVLPGMTGVELTRRLREHRADLPVILLSGYRGPMLEQEAKTAGIAQLLAKPITTAGLAQALAAIVA